MGGGLSRVDAASARSDSEENGLQKLVKPAVGAEASGHGHMAGLKEAVRRYARHCSAYRQPSLRRAAFQIASTALPLGMLAALMLWLESHAYWLVLLLAFPLGGLVVRCFIIQHDCGHGSFTSSSRVNNFIGRCMSVLTLTPYGLWRRAHAQHHATSGNLDRRGAGDIKTLTVDEYLSLSRGGQLRYRIYRHPAFLFLLGVPAFFVVMQRLPWGHPLPARECWRSVVGLDAAILGVYGVLALLVGLKELLLVALPAIAVASAIGGWLFFVQHQFEETHWDGKDDWDFQIAAIHGSSFYDLPSVLNWFTGSIGLHHIHHLNSMVPNYRLAECMAALPELASINRLTLLESFRCARLTLWDADERRLIGFAELRRRLAVGS
jgi:omega-6 fatty acid desaturase (delta-12 desaturase)